MRLVNNFCKKTTLFCLAIVIFLTSAFPALGDLKLPKPEGFVNDFADMLSSGTKNTLERKLRAYDEETTNEVVVVTVDNLQDTTVEDYAVRLFEKWKIGKKDKDNGVLLLVAKAEKKMRIEVGYGLEPTLTDAEAYGIITNTIRPKFKAGNYNEGVSDGVNQIVKGLSGEALPEASSDTKDSGQDAPGCLSVVWIIFVSTIVLGSWITAILARSKSWWGGGILGAIAAIVAMLLLGFWVGVVLLFVLVPLGLGLDYAVSKNYRIRKKKGENPSWWAGGGWGPGGGSGTSSGGGFGGFGGGSSGGGGASGGW